MAAALAWTPASAWESSPFAGSGSGFVEAVATDASGDVIAVGRQRNATSGNDDLAVVKLDGADGSVVWTRLVDGGGNKNSDMGRAVALDDNGDVFVVGTLENAAGSDLGVAKIDGATGGVLWTALVDGGNLYENGRDVAVLPDGDVVAVGSVGGTGGLDLAAVRLDGATGDEVWRYLRDGAYAPDGGDVAYAVAVGPDGHVVVTGGTYEATNSPDVAIAKIDAGTGSALWAKTREGGTGGPEEGFDLVIDAANDVYVAARYDTSAGGGNEFGVLKVAAATGNPLWTVARHVWWNEGAVAIAFGGADQVIAAGYAEVSGNGQSDLFAATIDRATGAIDGEYTRNGTATSSLDQLAGVAVGPSGDAFVAGYLNDAGSSTDAFAARLDGDTAAVVWTAKTGTTSSAERWEAVAVGPDGHPVFGGTGTGTTFFVAKRAATDGGDFVAPSDTDGDGLADTVDPDDDNDGVADLEDDDPVDPSVCSDDDLDGCDDCAVGRDGFGPGIDQHPEHDGTDADGDGICDSPQATDADGDGIADDRDVCPAAFDPFLDGQARVYVTRFVLGFEDDPTAGDEDHNDAVLRVGKVCVFEGGVLAQEVVEIAGISAGATRTNALWLALDGLPSAVTLQGAGAGARPAEPDVPLLPDVKDLFGVPGFVNTEDGAALVPSAAMRVIVDYAPVGAPATGGSCAVPRLSLVGPDGRIDESTRYEGNRQPLLGRFPHDWRVPIEWTPIGAAYPQFVAWVADLVAGCGSGCANEDTWFEVPEPGLVIERPGLDLEAPVDDPVCP